MKKIIKFSTAGCFPCAQYLPLFQSVTSEHKGDIPVEEYELFTGEDPDDKILDLATKYEVRTVPNTIFQREDGEWISKQGRLTEAGLMDGIKYCNE